MLPKKGAGDISHFGGISKKLMIGDSLSLTENTTLSPTPNFVTKIDTLPTGSDLQF